MNRCSICDITDEDNPKAGIKFYTLDDHPEGCGEFRCLECNNTVEANLEDLSIGDEDFEFQNV